jgi:mannose-6-phosphate isomerase-like protein (cupin superfamily)
MEPLPLEQLTIDNTNYRKVLRTTPNMQLVLMSLLPGEEIGEEIHPYTTQFIRVEQGQAIAIVDNKKYNMKDGDSIMIPLGIKHNIINPSRTAHLKLYTIYSPPEHPYNRIEVTKSG